ncbi:hypothetical protein Prudu_000568 [Prunus dulcis]|uniref:Uncharacterized protein n=1 Tax=Prunus dulcis TaxID=3755 RepID=A0A4Y1QLT6_PRUDU|nr:hypothetical protein Prudu_000568 [Prunus dulcis]
MGQLVHTYRNDIISRWKILNKELAKWRNALAKAMDNHRSGENLAVRLCKHKCGLVLLGKGKKVSTIPIVGRW